MATPLRTGPLEELRLDIMACSRCSLSGERSCAVPGSGRSSAKIMLIGEAPDKYEEAVGSPFLGKSGKRLDDWLEKAGLNRNDCFVTHVLKCRPPKNRFPRAEEFSSRFPPTQCWPWLEQQIKAVNPLAVVLFGKMALQHVLLAGAIELPDPVGPWIGRLCRRRDRFGEVRFGMSYHPSYIERNKNPYEESQCLDALHAVSAYVTALEHGRAAPVEDLYEVRAATPIQYQRRLRLFGQEP